MKFHSAPNRSRPSRRSLIIAFQHDSAAIGLDTEHLVVPAARKRAQARGAGRGQPARGEPAGQWPAGRHRCLLPAQPRPKIRRDLRPRRKAREGIETLLGELVFGIEQNLAGPVHEPGHSENLRKVVDKSLAAEVARTGDLLFLGEFKEHVLGRDGPPGHRSGRDRSGSRARPHACRASAPGSDGGSYG